MIYQHLTYTADMPPDYIAYYSRYVSGPHQLPGRSTTDDDEQNYGASYLTCDKCNYGQHICHGCGDELNHDWTESTSYGPERVHPDCEGY